MFDIVKSRKLIPAKVYTIKVIISAPGQNKSSYIFHQAVSLKVHHKHVQHLELYHIA